MTEPTCPKCGAEFEDDDGEFIVFECETDMWHSGVIDYEASDCLRNQLATVTKERYVATEGWRQGAIYNTFADKEITRLRGLLREAGEQLRITRGWYQLMQPYHMPAMKPKYEAMMDVILRITPTEGEGDEVESRNQ